MAVRFLFSAISGIWSVGKVEYYAKYPVHNKGCHLRGLRISPVEGAL